MKNILRKSFCRKTILVEQLTYHEEATTLKDLQSVTGSTKQTVLKDIEELNHYYSFLTIKLVDGKYTIEYHDSTNIQNVYREVLNHDPFFKIFEVMFFKPGLSVEEMAQQIFMSTSTLYRSMPRINETLEKHFNIRIGKLSMAFDGKEEDIRAFYIQYFIEKTPVFEWCFDELVEEEHIDDLSQLLLGQLDYYFDMKSFSVLRLMKFTMVVNLRRTLLEKEIQQEWNWGVDLIDQLFDNQPDLMKSYEEKLGIPLTPHMLKQAIAPYLQLDFCFSYSDLERRKEGDPSVANAVKVLEDGIQILEDNYPVHLNCREEFIMHIYNTAVLGAFENDATHVLWDSKREFIGYAKRYFPTFYNQVHQLILTVRDNLNLVPNRALENHLVYTFFSHWPNLILDLQKPSRPLHALVISQFDSYHAQMITDILSLRFGDRVQFHVFTETEINLSDISDRGYDVIYTNTYIPNLDHTDVFIYSNFMTTQEANRLIEHLEGVYRKKFSKLVSDLE